MNTDNLIVGILRIMGLDEQQLGRMAMNILVYLGDVIARKWVGDDSLDNEIPRYRSLVKEVSNQRTYHATSHHL